MELEYGLAYPDEHLLEHKISVAKKGREWGKAQIDNIINLSSFNGNTFNNKDLINVNLAKGVINKTDFLYVTNPYGLKDKSLPAEFMNFNIIKGKKRLIIGEERARPFRFTVTSSNPDTVSEISEMEKDLLLQNAQAEVIKRLEKNGTLQPQVDQATGQPMPTEAQTPEEIKEYVSMTYKQAQEVIAQRSLNYLRKYLNLEEQFVDGLDDFLDTNKEVYGIDVVANEPRIRKVNTFYFDWGKNPNSPWVEDGEWAVELRMMPPSDVYDECQGLGLSDKEYEEIESYRRANNNSNGSWLAGKDSQGTGIQYTPNAQFNEEYKNVGLIPVFRCVFKTLRKVGYLTYVDELGMEQETVVDETFKITEKAVYDENGNFVAGQKVEWDWIPQLYEGTKIGNNIYTKIQPLKSHYNSLDNIAKCPLPYIGYWSDDPSFVEDAKPYQYFYLVLMWRLQLAFASDKGRVMLMDITQIPKKNGWNVERWLYYLDAMKVMFVDPHSEGWIKRGNKPSSFNQFQSIDMSLGNSIEGYIRALDKLDSMLQQMTGITPQRQGQISSSETVGGVERSVTQSSHITEYIFARHNEVKRRVLTGLLEISKEAWKNGKKIHYFDDTYGRVAYEVDGEKYSNSEHDVWVSDNIKDFNNLEMIKQMAKDLINSNKGSLSDVISIMTTQSIADVTNKVKMSEQKAAEQAGAQAKMEQERADKDRMENMKLRLRELDIEEGNNIRDNDTDKENNIRDNDTKLKIAGMNIENESTEIPEDNSLDYTKVQQKQQEINQKDKQFNTQIAVDMKMHNDKMEKEDKKIAVSKTRNNRPSSSK